MRVLVALVLLLLLGCSSFQYYTDNPENTCMIDAEIEQAKLREIGVDSKILVIQRKIGIGHAVLCWRLGGMMHVWDKTKGTRICGDLPFELPFLIAVCALRDEGGLQVIKSAEYKP